MELKTLERKRHLLISIILFLFLLIIIPALFGVWHVIAGKENIPSPLVSIQVAILATALGAVTLWFAQPSLTGVGSGVRRSYLWFVMENCGRLFLFGAFCFTVFGMLSPWLAAGLTVNAIIDTELKVITYGSFALGTIALTLAVCNGLVLIWLRRM